MADVAAIVGLFASVITFVVFRTGILSRIVRFTIQSSELPGSLLSGQVPLLGQTLQRIEARANASHVLHDVARYLKALADSIHAQIKTLKARLRSTTTTTDVSRLEKGLKSSQSLGKYGQVTQSAEKTYNGVDTVVLRKETTSIDLRELIPQQTTDDINRDLHKPASQKLDNSSIQQTFGLCLEQAAQIDPDAFVGRTAEIQQLNDWLSPGDESQSQKVVSIWGTAGLGKTQLSLAFALKRGSQFTSVFWLNAKDKLSLQQSLLAASNLIFADHGVSINSIEEEEARVRRLSETWNNRWLLIFDAYDELVLPGARSPTWFDLSTFFPHQAHGSLLITSRFPYSTSSKSLALQQLDDQAGVLLLSQRMGQDTSSVMYLLIPLSRILMLTDPDAQRLATRLKGLPLALATAGTYLAQTGISCADYLVEYEGAWGDLSGPKCEVNFRYSDPTLSSTWTISVDHVSRQDADAAELLKFFAFLSNDDVWYELVRAGAPEGPAWMKQVTATKIRFDRAMTKLRDYRLVDVVLGSYRVHPWVHEWLLERYQLASKRSWFLAALNCVTGSMLNDIIHPQYWTVRRRLVRHVQKLSHQRFHGIWDALSSEETTANASDEFASLFQELGHLGEAEQMCTRALAAREKAYGVEHTSTLYTIHKLGGLCSAQGKLAEAERMLSRAIAGYKNIVKNGNRPKLYTTHNLAINRLTQDKLAEAEQMLTEVLAGRKKTQHISELEAARNIGILKHSQGKLTEAEQIFVQVLVEFEEIAEIEHSSILDTLYHLGHIYHTQGKLTEAEALYIRALAAYEKKPEGERALIFDTLYNLGHVYHTQSKFVEAEPLYLRALAGYEKNSNSEPSAVLDTLDILGNLYHAQGKLAEAEQVMERVLAGRENVYGVTHTTTLETLHGLGLVYHAHDKLAEAEQVLKRVLAGREKAYGVAHKLTLETLHDLGHVYHAHGKLAEAEPMYKRALAGREKVCGMEHTLTLDTVHHLGHVYFAHDKLAEAEAMYKRALVGRETAQGKEHSSTLESMYHLGILQHNRGKLVEAEQMYSRVLAGYEKTFGKEHALTQKTARSLESLQGNQSWLDMLERGVSAGDD